MPNSRRWSVIVCLGSMLLATGNLLSEREPLRAEDRVTTTTSRLAADLMFLASDELAGRDVGSPGIALAGEYIAGRFQRLGLVTDLFDGGPYQDFKIPGPATLGAPERNSLRFEGAAGTSQLSLEDEFTPVSLGRNGAFSGEVVFVGYGITAPELNYDDYANMDVRGKVVIVLRKEPRQNDPSSPFDGTQPSQHAFFSSKELNAAMHGAAALIFVNDQTTVARSGADQLPKLTAAGSAINDQQIPTLYCLRSTVDKLLQSAGGESLHALEMAIDRDIAPHSYALAGIHASGETHIVQSQTPVRNVVGLLPGHGSLAVQYVVIGAHYDHVGTGGVGSLAPGTIEIHNGADDNASGTAVLLEVARRLANEASASAAEAAEKKVQAAGRRSIIFIAFTGEERGLLGSKYFVRNPRWPLERTVAMLNMDMVGRMEGNSLTVYGTGTAEQFDSLVDRTSAPLGLAIDKQPAGFGPSDHASFYEANIPVLHFFTGLHNDYHRPSDDYDKINFPGMAMVTDIVTSIASELVSSPYSPELLQTSAVAHIGRPVPSQRAILGVRLDAQRSVPTVVDVSPGGAASLAGIRAGDIISAIDEQPISHVSELHRQLELRIVGGNVTITILRGDENLRLTTTLQGG
ncbi:MAG: M28 family peptidase [Pirellulaceae bacterium]|nr:M28 family peptidase [Pirellulaceae bacterium]